MLGIRVAVPHFTKFDIGGGQRWRELGLTGGLRTVSRGYTPLLTLIGMIAVQNTKWRQTRHDCTITVEHCY